MLPIHPAIRAMYSQEIPCNDEYIYTAALHQIDLVRSGEASPASVDIVSAGLQIIAMLLNKNRAYGNSALEPITAFGAHLPVSERLAVRMDDKISRLMRGQAAGEDPALDLAGYLVLYLAARIKEDIPEHLAEFREVFGKVLDASEESGG